MVIYESSKSVYSRHLALRSNVNIVRDVEANDLFSLDRHSQIYLI